MATPDDVPAPRPEHSAARGIAEAAARALAERHPQVTPRTVEAVVFQAACELASHAHVPGVFQRMLDRRAEARLRAMTGTLTPIRGPRALALD